MRPFCRLDLLPAHNGYLLGFVQGDRGDPFQAGVDGEEEPGERRGPLGGRAPDLIECVRGRQTERPARGPRQRPEVGTTAQPFPKVAGERADVGPGAALDLQDGRRPIRISGVPLDKLQPVDRDRPWLEIGRLPLPGELVGPPAADLEGAVCRRPLLDRPAELAQRRFDGLARGSGPRAAHELAVAIVRLRRGSEADRGPVCLRIAHVVLDNPCGQTQEDRQDA